MQGPDQTDLSPDDVSVVEDIRDFFLNPTHWIYTSPGTPSLINPNSVYHVGQLEVLFEDRHFHFITNPAIRRLRAEGFLNEREVSFGANRVTMVWRRNVRYAARPIRDHVRLVEEYSADAINRATGDYAETLILSTLRSLHLDLVSRNSREHGGRVWVETAHDLDFIMEREGVGYGVEVKNTWPYFPADELAVKLRLCSYLGLRPIFIARNRHAGQYQAVANAGGALFVFKSKIFPPGQEDLTKRIWHELRLPVAVRNEFIPRFSAAIKRFVDAQEVGEASL